MEEEREKMEREHERWRERQMSKRDVPHSRSGDPWSPRKDG